MNSVSVILCTHNPKPAYLARTLQALRNQTLAPTEWEFLIIDNCSDSPLTDSLDLGWKENARVILEEKLGLTPARLRGIHESNGKLLVFVDDDNVLDPDFLEVALRVADDRPFLGSWSGQCRPDFEVTPPEWTRRYWGNLVIREFDKDCWSNLPRLAATMPCGAGMCVRCEVAEKYAELHESGARGFQFDRTGDSLVSGGDNDLAACACDIGLGVGLVSELGLDHLSRLAEGIHFSSALLDHARGLPVEARSSRRRILDWLRLLRTPQPNRSIQSAAIRGLDQAVEALGKEASSSIGR
jgi:hypothetical protein